MPRDGHIRSPCRMGRFWGRCGSFRQAEKTLPEPAAGSIRKDRFEVFSLYPTTLRVSIAKGIFPPPPPSAFWAAFPMFPAVPLSSFRAARCRLSVPPLPLVYRRRFPCCGVSFPSFYAVRRFFARGRVGFSQNTAHFHFVRQRMPVVSVRRFGAALRQTAPPHDRRGLFRVFFVCLRFFRMSSSCAPASRPKQKPQTLSGLRRYAPVCSASDSGACVGPL